MRNSVKVIVFSLGVCVGAFALVGFLCVSLFASIAFLSLHLDTLLKSASTPLGTFVSARDDKIQVG